MRGRDMHISKSHFVSQLRDRLPQSKNDKGAAIVAAVGVMLICLSLGALVVSQAIRVNRDSGRDRARTSEVRTAEGVVDAVFKEMQLGNFSCEWPDSGTEPIG